MMTYEEYIAGLRERLVGVSNALAEYLRFKQNTQHAQSSTEGGKGSGE